MLHHFILSMGLYESMNACTININPLNPSDHCVVELSLEEEEEEEEETLFDPKSTNIQITIPHISDIQFKQLCTHIYRHYVHKHSS